MSQNKPPLLDKDNKARIIIAEYILVPDPLLKVKESYIACFLLGCRIQWEADIKFYTNLEKRR